MLRALALMASGDGSGFDARFGGTGPDASTAPSPDWSPDDTRIALNSPAAPAATQNIWTIHPDGTGVAELTTYKMPAGRHTTQRGRPTERMSQVSAGCHERVT